MERKAARDGDAIREALRAKGTTIDKGIPDEVAPLHMSPKWSDGHGA